MDAQEKDIKLIADSHAAWLMKDLHDFWSQRLCSLAIEFENFYIQCALLTLIMAASIYFFNQNSTYSYVFTGFLAGFGACAFMLKHRQKRMVADTDAFLKKRFESMKIAAGVKEELE